MEVSENIKNEIDVMISSLESARDEMQKKFKSIFDEYVSESFDRFYNCIECDTRYNFDRWIRQTCDEIIEGLLAGDTKWLKHQNIISEYNWEKLNKVRIAIWEANGGEIANSLIAVQKNEIEELSKQIKVLREYNHRSY